MRASVRIDLSALQHNFEQIKKIVPTAYVMAMIKANAYGHSLLPVAQALSQADGFGVATIDEAIALRQADIRQPLVVMSGFVDEAELRCMVDNQLTAVIHHSNQIQILQRTTLSSPFSVWLKIDTGMKRLGFLPEEASTAYQALLDHPQVRKPLVFMTHLACSDQHNHPHTTKQIAQFHQTVASWPGLRSLACSAAILDRPQTHADWVRPGILLYGISPFSDKTGLMFGLKPVMTLTARLISVKEARKGESIGYGDTWICPKDTKIGVVSIGYGDGYPRHAKSGTPVLINAERCALIGRVSMDLITVDLENQPHAKLGDTVVLWGQGLPVEEIAACAGTIGYELVCKITARVPMCYSTTNVLSDNA